MVIEVGSKDDLIKLLSSSKYLSLATVNDEGNPQAAICAYVNIDEKVYIGTSSETSKVKNIAGNPNIAYSLDNGSDDWGAMQEIQMTGSASILNDEKLAQEVFGLMGEKFPQVKEMPADREMVFLEIVPKSAKWSDYSKGFGNMEIIDF